MKKKPSEEKSPVAFWEEFLKVMNLKRRKMENVNCLNKEDWNRMIDFMVYGVIRMEKAFREPLARVKLKL
ncbi:MAG: hypothetical protein IPJ20_26580 [Flammeovirgaceae bacterium]|nr:hypothetical protein [Flammeovirgaceae bacterium]